ncbi:uncharacterized protein LOC131843637 [Achroia grisella]|uniref:uncharacterized protein LOC131843637 n=1 Tax=Achroia grisella TaxID=688607 RepID=UPI0027D2B8E3|nr:uncharacterized protein LOC131843637 [Achroia grisella]
MANNNCADSDSDHDYDTCSVSRSNSCSLPFDPTSIENLILKIADKFDFRVVLNDGRARGALVVTTGLALAGALLGHHYGGKLGEGGRKWGGIAGGVVGGACGAGLAAVSMRDIWKDIKFKLSELFDIVYDYLAGLGIDDYKRAAMFLTKNGSVADLAMIILKTTSSILGQKILSSLPAAN